MTDQIPDVEPAVDGALSKPAKSRRGFASMDPAKVREIAAMGGAAVPSNRRSFSQNRDLARTAGAKGGSISRLPLTPQQTCD
ncbi:general stress protein [Brevundimonas sp. BAL450]|uniref:general stress protein n=1 Tax=Brevundimonas sp. BAL450 TaxID=1708162 RepID=UPI00351C53A0